MKILLSLSIFASFAFLFSCASSSKRPPPREEGLTLPKSPDAVTMAPTAVTPVLSMKPGMDEMDSRDPDANCSKVYCMLKNNEPACCSCPGYCCGCAHPELSDDECANNPNERLTVTDVKNVISSVKDTADGCFYQFGTLGKIVIKITVSCDGVVLNTSASGDQAGSMAANCIESAVLRLKFPKFKTPSTTHFNYPFIAR